MQFVRILLCLLLAMPVFAQQLVYNPRVQAIDVNGNPISGAKLYVDDAGTSTDRTTYSDSVLSSANANPLVADSSGRFGPIYLAPSSTGIKLTLTTSADVNVWTQDNIPTSATTSYVQTAEELAADVTPVNFEYEPGDIRRYGDNTTPGTTDMTAVVQDWLDVGGRLLGYPGEYRLTATVTISENGTHIDGRGMELEHDTATDEPVLHGEQLTDITIENLEVDGQKSQKSVSGVAVGAYGIWLQGSDNVRILNNHVYDTYEHGIRVSSIDGTDTEVESNQVLIQGNVVEDCGNDANDRGWGIWTFGLVRGLVISDNFVLDCISGIASDETSSSGTADRSNFDVVIADNFIRVADDVDSGGIRFEGSARGSITGNVVSESWYGLLFQEGQAHDGVTGYTVVSGNVFRGAEDGAFINNVHDAVIDGNLFELYSTDGDSGIEMYTLLSGTASARVTVSNNVIRSVKHGIRHGKAAAHTGSNIDGLQVLGNNVFYTGSVAATSGMNGIDIANADNSLVKGNSVHDFYNGMVSAGTTTWDGNYEYDSVSTGMSMSGTSARLIRGNSFESTVNIDSGTNLFTTRIIDNVFGGTVTGTFTTTYRRGNIGPSSISDIVVAATVIADDGSTLNTVGKHVGMIVWDSTNNRYMRASGPGATDAWHSLDGATTVTPS